MRKNTLYSYLVVVSSLLTVNINAQKEFDSQISESNVIMAKSAKIRADKGIPEEVLFLKETCKNIKPGDPVKDEALFKLSDYFLDTEKTQKAFASLMTDEQCLRLLDKAKTQKKLSAQIFCCEQLLNQTVPGNLLKHNNKLRARVMHDLAIAYNVTEFTPTKSIEIWKQMSQDFKDTPEGRVGEVYFKAVTDPDSIASMEALYQLSIAQNQWAWNKIGAFFFTSLFIRSCEKPYYKEFLASPGVPQSDKVDLLSGQIYSNYMASQYSCIPELSKEIFARDDYKTTASENAAFLVGLAYHKQNAYQQAIGSYENFLRAFPHSPRVPQALFYMSMVEHARGNFLEAASLSSVIMEMYPNSQEAKGAKVRFDMLSGLGTKGDWSLSENILKKRAEVHAYLTPQKQYDIAVLWPAKLELNQTIALSSGTLEAPQDCFQRLALVYQNCEFTK